MSTVESFAAVQARTPQQIIAEWREAQALLAKAKDVESALRQEVLRGAFEFKGENDDRSGTQYFELRGGARLKAVFKQNYKIDPDKIDGALESIENSGPEGKFVADRLVKFKPELSVSEYKLLADDSSFKQCIDDALTISAGTPSLEFVEPKAKK